MTEKNQLIELIYDENLVLAAELLYEAKAVEDLIRTSSNLYIGKVKDGKEYEIEIQSPFAKKQKSSCDCVFFKNTGVCKHIIAGLLQIRASIHQTNEKKIAHQIDPKPKKFSSLNSTHILEEITHEDLVAFVKNYARSDKKFSIQLKVTFARKVDLTDNADKYKTILNAIVRPNTGQESRANSSDVRALIQVLEDFEDQINDCIALGQFREAFNIFSTSFSKLEYVIHYYTYHAEKLHTLQKNYHSIISYFLREKLPQELRSDLLSFLTDMAARSYYHYSDINNNIVGLIYKEFSTKEKHKLTELLHTLIEQRPTKEVSYLLALWIIVKGKYTPKEADIFKQYSFLTIEICDILIGAGHENHALKILESQYKRNKHVKDIVSRLVFLYVRIKDIEKLIETATLAYYKSGDARYLEILKKETDEATYQKAIVEMETRLISDGADPDLIIRLYKKEENWSGLLHFIAGTKSLELLKNHDGILFKHERNGLIMLYLYLISTYLNEHMGDISFQYMETLKNHLARQKMELLVDKIGELIREKYHNRPRLTELFGV